MFDQLFSGLIIAGISAAVAFAVSWGYSMKSLEAIHSELDKHAEHHRQHYLHANDYDAHWTTRERDSLTKQLDRIDIKLQQLLDRHGGEA